MQAGIGGGTLPWQPSVDGDFLPRTALEALDRGEVARVPTLVGTNRDEWRLFTLFDRAAGASPRPDLRRRLARQLGSEADADAMLAVYRAAQRGRRSPARLWEAVQSDRVFHHPAQRAADGLAELGIPVGVICSRGGRRCRQSDRLRPRDRAAVRVRHAARRLPAPHLGASRTAQRLSRRMRDAWIAFARDGEPGHARLPDWPAYDAKERATLEFDRESALIHAPFAADRSSGGRGWVSEHAGNATTSPRRRSFGSTTRSWSCSRAHRAGGARCSVRLRRARAT